MSGIDALINRALNSTPSWPSTTGFGRRLSDTSYVWASSKYCKAKQGISGTTSCQTGTDLFPFINPTLLATVIKAWAMVAMKDMAAAKALQQALDSYATASLPHFSGFSSSPDPAQCMLEMTMRLLWNPGNTLPVPVVACLYQDYGKGKTIADIILSQLVGLFPPWKRTVSSLLSTQAAIAPVAKSSSTAPSLTTLVSFMANWTNLLNQPLDAVPVDPGTTNVVTWSQLDPGSAVGKLSNSTCTAARIIKWVTQAAAADGSTTSEFRHWRGHGHLLRNAEA